MLEVAKLEERLRKLGLKLVFDEGVDEFLVEKGNDPSLGARPLRRVVQNYIEDPLAEKVLGGLKKKNIRVKLNRAKTELEFK